MFGISMWETAMIVLVALVVLGPKQLIEVARAGGKLYRDLQRMIWDVRQSVDIDSIMSPPSPPPKIAEPHAPAPSQSDPIVPPAVASNRGSGPDFYAELLETSKKDAEKEAEVKTEPDPTSSAPPHQAT